MFNVKLCKGVVWNYFYDRIFDIDVCEGYISIIIGKVLVIQIVFIVWNRGCCVGLLFVIKKFRIVVVKRYVIWMILCYKCVVIGSDYGIFVVF